MKFGLRRVASSQNIYCCAFRLVKFDPDSEEFTYYPLPRQTDNPNLDTTRDGAIIYSTRASRQAAIGFFYPDVSTMKEFGAFR